MLKNNAINWLEKIRNSDNATKKFWLYLLSSISMTMVVSLWITYISFNLPSVSNQYIATNDSVAHKSKPSTVSSKNYLSLFSDAGIKFSRGVALAKTLINDYILGEPNTIEIKRADGNFILDNLPKVSSQKLPE